MRMMISKLPRDLVEEILSRVPMRSMGVVRSTCKEFHILSLTKDQSFSNKHIGKEAASAREREFVMITDCRVYLISVNLFETHNNNNFHLSINRKGIIINRENSDQILNTSQVFHCHGLLLCVLKNNNNRLLVWKRFIKRRKYDSRLDSFAFGNDRSCGSHKILKFYRSDHEIYDFSSHSWRVLSITLDWNIENDKVHVSLKGNTYWYARDRKYRECFLLCFDFTRERFGPRLSLPLSFDINYKGTVRLSTVREEKLVLLVQRWSTLEMEIWVTDKIEPDSVSWTNFLKVDMNPVNPLANFSGFKSFFIVEDKKIDVVFGEEGNSKIIKTCIIGENGYFTRVDLENSADIRLRQFVCSYVPTCVQIK